MALSLRTFPSERPLYRQLVEELRADVAKRAVGDRIDSEPKLAQRFGVSRFTVARAIEILVDEGLVRRRQGLGSFVAPPSLVRARPPSVELHRGRGDPGSKGFPTGF